MTEMTDKEKELEEWLNQVHFGSCCSDPDSTESPCDENSSSEIMTKIDDHFEPLLKVNL